MFKICMNAINKESHIRQLLIYDHLMLMTQAYTIRFFKSEDIKIISFLINAEIDKMNKWLIANKFH